MGQEDSKVPQLQAAISRAKNDLRKLSKSVQSRLHDKRCADEALSQARLAADECEGRLISLQRQLAEEESERQRRLLAAEEMRRQAEDDIEGALNTLAVAMQHLGGAGVQELEARIIEAWRTYQRGKSRGDAEAET